MYLGDFLEDQTVDFDFSTTYNGAMITLAGSPVVKVYKGSSTSTEVTTGVTLTVDFDGVTGSHHVTIVTTDAFYATASNYTVRLTTGTVGGVSQAGRILAHFSIENRKVILADSANHGGTNTTMNFNKWIFTTPTGDSIFFNTTSGYSINMGNLGMGSAFVTGDVIFLGTTTFSQEIIANSASNDITGIDVKKLNGSATAASRASEFWAGVERLTVDTTGFAGSTTTFQLSNTVDEQNAYLNQALYCPSTGETVFVTGYAFSTKVRLTVSTMVGTPTNGTIFLKMGRKV